MAQVILNIPDEHIPALRAYAPLALNYTGANTNAAKDAFLKVSLADVLKGWIIRGAVIQATDTAKATAEASVSGITIT